MALFICCSFFSFFFCSFFYSFEVFWGFLREILCFRLWGFDFSFFLLYLVFVVFGICGSSFFLFLL
ncbi:hypothetical protein BZA77DRAFT_154437 [Pyronema omphalodes]|nr:hypothetical protein BZA77DRAFT_154437 [Pyronema omphalodes]